MYYLLMYNYNENSDKYCKVINYSLLTCIVYLIMLSCSTTFALCAVF